MEGVIRTRVGYAGGKSTNPTYLNLENHTETVQIEYDPALVSFDKLLEEFWNAHNPYSRARSRQYASILFYHDDTQKQKIEDFISSKENTSSKTVYTEVLPFEVFYPAEDYHQKYYLRQEPVIFRDFISIYPTIEDFTSSTAAARVNGFIGGYGSLENLEKQIDLFGLSTEAKTKLLQLAHRLQE